MVYNLSCVVLLLTLPQVWPGDVSWHKVPQRRRCVGYCVWVSLPAPHLWIWHLHPLLGSACLLQVREVGGEGDLPCPESRLLWGVGVPSCNFLDGRILSTASHALHAWCVDCIGLGMNCAVSRTQLVCRVIKLVSESLSESLWGRLVFSVNLISPPVHRAPFRQKRSQACDSSWLGGHHCSCGLLKGPPPFLRGTLTVGLWPTQVCTTWWPYWCGAVRLQGNGASSRDQWAACEADWASVSGHSRGHTRTQSHMGSHVTQIRGDWKRPWRVRGGANVLS